MAGKKLPEVISQTEVMLYMKACGMGDTLMAKGAGLYRIRKKGECEFLVQLRDVALPSQYRWNNSAGERIEKRGYYVVYPVRETHDEIELAEQYFETFNSALVFFLTKAGGM